MFKYFANLFSKPKTEEPVVAPPSTDGGPVYKVPITTIVSVEPHNNAHSLSVATVYGFQVVVQKDKYKVGDQVVYIPIDSLLPQWLEDKLFPPDSKIKLHHHRVRQIKIRGLASQGMLIDMSDVKDKLNKKVGVESDVSSLLEVTKYEPPQPGFAHTQGKAKNRNKKHEHPLFHKYNGVDNIKWFPTLFKDSEEVVVQEKLHGTNARASNLPFVANTWRKKLKKLFFMAPKFEQCYGSNNVDISAATDYKGFYGEDIYGKCFADLDIFEKLALGEIVYGEIVGPSIQKGYDYGLKEHKFVVFDVKVLQPDGKFKWLNPSEVATFCEETELTYVPVLYKGPYDKDVIYGLTKGPSAFCPTQKVREGVVVKSSRSYDRDGNKRALKWVSEDYLADKNNTDFH